uniref:Uncharacterized protein n=1 Tax=Arundo donax TaxID=35708 RepID=A0A0A9HKQ8_ARUDO
MRILLWSCARSKLTIVNRRSRYGNYSQVSGSTILHFCSNYFCGKSIGVDRG